MFAHALDRPVCYAMEIPCTPLSLSFSPLTPASTPFASLFLDNFIPSSCPISLSRSCGVARARAGVVFLRSFSPLSWRYPLSTPPWRRVPANDYLTRTHAKIAKPDLYYLTRWFKDWFARACERTKLNVKLYLLIFKIYQKITLISYHGWHFTSIYPFLF